MSELKPCVYLAGPISGCNEKQRTLWRKTLAVALGGSSRVDIEDPSTWDAKWDPAREIKALNRADIVVANMWRESIGTTIGIVHARMRGIPVVLIDPNHLENQVIQGILGPEKPVTDLKAAAERVDKLIASRNAVPSVQKKDGSTVPFRRQNLTRSIRTACSAAGIEDSIIPSLIIHGTIRHLTGQTGNTRVSTGKIKEVIHAQLQSLERDTMVQTELRDSAAAVREAWAKRENHKTPEELFDRAVDEKCAVERENDNLHARITALEADLRARGGRQLLPGTRTKWRSVADALTEAESRYPDALMIHSKAHRSATDSPFRGLTKAFTVLCLLGDCARERITAKKNNSRMPGPKEWFMRNQGKLGGFRYAARETPETLAHWGSEREIIVEGVKYQMEQHLGLGDGGPDGTIRIYFHPRPDGGFIVGHCGRHPTNTKT